MRSNSWGLIVSALLALAPAAHADDAAKPAAAAGLAPAPASATASPLAGLPAWRPPAEYRQDMVMTNGDQTMAMRRFCKGDQIRTEMAFQDEQMVMIEKGGESYEIMPSHKMMMKMPAHAPQLADSAGPPPDVKIEPLGPEKLGGRDALKYRVTSQGQTGLAWFDAASGAPIRMETNGASIEWANFAAGKQADELFELPKDYQTIDIAALQGAMGGMGGIPTVSPGAITGGQAPVAIKGAKGGIIPGGGLPAGLPAGIPGMSGMPGMGGVGGGGASGIAQQMGSHFGQSMGEKFGASMGAQFGPLGSMAGSYIGGRIGGWLGAHAAAMVTGGGEH